MSRLKKTENKTNAFLEWKSIATPFFGSKNQLYITNPNKINSSIPAPKFVMVLLPPLSHWYTWSMCIVYP